MGTMIETCCIEVTKEGSVSVLIPHPQEKVESQNLLPPFSQCTHGFVITSSKNLANFKLCFKRQSLMSQGQNVCSLLDSHPAHRRTNNLSMLLKRGSCIKSRNCELAQANAALALQAMRPVKASASLNSERLNFPIQVDLLKLTAAVSL